MSWQAHAPCTAQGNSALKQHYQAVHMGVSIAWERQQRPATHATQCRRGPGEVAGHTLLAVEAGCGTNTLNAIGSVVSRNSGTCSVVCAAMSHLAAPPLLDKPNPACS